MGRKVHPIGYRLGYTTRWESIWYADRDYTKLLLEDIDIRDLVRKYLEAPGGRDSRRGGGRRRGSFGAGVSRIEIERNTSHARVVIHTARPGIVIGRGGSNREEIQKRIQKQTGRRVVVDVREIDQPELDAFLVARNVADQLERRVSFRRAIKMTAERSIRAGAEGVKIMVSGRLGGREMSRTEFELLGTVPLQTLDADIDYGLVEARTTAGRIGVKAWVHRGDARAKSQLLSEPVARPSQGGRRAAART
jgi:small subunit ribosomal protein S3